MANVFISYAHHNPDEQLAQELADALRGGGHRVFIDTGIQPGARWSEEIDLGIAEADYFFLLLSETSAHRDTIVAELDLAYRRVATGGSPRIIAIRINYPFDKPLPYQVHTCLIGLQQVQWEGPEATQSLLQRLLDVTHGRAAGESPAVRIADAPDLAVARAADEEILPRHNGQSQAEVRTRIVLGRPLLPQSPYYVEREGLDDELTYELAAPGAVVTVLGPRRTGRTSAIARACAALDRTEPSIRAVFIDMQAMSAEQTQSSWHLWRSIALRTAGQLGLPKWDASSWHEDSPHDIQFEQFLQQTIFAAGADTSLLLAFDEVDAISETAAGLQFFRTIRTSINGAAAPGKEMWRNVGWLLNTSTEPRFFILDPHESPFEVGVKIVVHGFNHHHISTLAGRYGLTLDEDGVEGIWRFLGGQPYLTHLTLVHMLQGKVKSVQDAFAQGLYDDHLGRFLLKFRAEPALAGAMCAIIRGQDLTGEDAEELTSRIVSAGLARRTTALSRTEPASELYAQFFGKALNCAPATGS